MDLLCTENIMHEYETETLCHHHHQPSFSAEQHQHQKKQLTAVGLIASSHSSPPSGYSSNSSNCSSTNSSGYSSSSSSSYCGTGRHYQTTKLTCVEPSPVLLDAASEALTVLQQQPHQSQTQTHSACDSTTLTQSAYHRHSIARSLDYVNTATEDPTFLTDRCLENALKTEEKRPLPICTYFKTVQKDITPPMRKIVAEWMMEVCAEEKCQEEVVLLALNYMDRFLSTKSVRKTHLQILAAACLLLASKLREPSCRALSAELLVFYTDNSIHKADLIKWELFVLSRLGWDLSCVTPLDFLELLLIRLPIRNKDYPDLDVDKVRQHAQAFISLAAKEHHFSMYSASTIAASSIAAALSGLNWHLRTGQNLRHLLNLLTDLTSVEQDYLHDCMMKMESIFEEHSRNLQPYLGSVENEAQPYDSYNSGTGAANHSAADNPYVSSPIAIATQSQCIELPNYLHYHAYHQHHHSASSTSAASSASSTSSHDSASGNVAANVLLPHLAQTCKMQANTQKEVQDVKF